MRTHIRLTALALAAAMSAAWSTGVIDPQNVLAESGKACLDIIDGGAETTSTSVSVNMVLARASCPSKQYRVVLHLLDGSEQSVTHAGNGSPILYFSFPSVAPDDVTCARGETISYGAVHDTAPDSGCAVLSSIAGYAPTGDYDGRLTACLDLRYLAASYALTGSVPTLTVDAELWRESCASATYRLVAWRPLSNGGRSVFYRSTVHGDGVHRNVAYGPIVVPGAARGTVCYSVTSRTTRVRDRLTDCTKWQDGANNGGGRGFN